MFPLKARLDLLSDSPQLRTVTFGYADDDQTRPLRAFACGDAAQPRVYVAAGVHGDEPEGVEAALRLLESLADASIPPLTRHPLVVLPCLNPSGLAQGTRANALDQDINRQFHADTLSAPSAVRRFVQPAQSAALIDLHSDSAAQGFYLFELLQDNVTSLAAPIHARLTQQGHTLEAAPFYAGCLGAPGLIAPTPTEMEDFIRLAPGASLAQWGWQSGIPRSYVFEAPQAAGFEAGVAMHLTALSALFAALENETRGAVQQ